MFLQISLLIDWLNYHMPREKKTFIDIISIKTKIIHKTK
jgi:hypothetical protein